MILSFDTIKKVKTTEEHNSTYSSDSGIAGTYVPNMSKDDMQKWKAKHIKGDDERIEIRKTMHGTQLLIIVYKKNNKISWEEAIRTNQRNEYHKKHQDIHISMNGKLQLDLNDYKELNIAIDEAKDILNIK